MHITTPTNMRGSVDYYYITAGLGPLFEVASQWVGLETATSLGIGNQWDSMLCPLF